MLGRIENSERQVKRGDALAVTCSCDQVLVNGATFRFPHVFGEILPNHYTGAVDQELRRTRDVMIVRPRRSVQQTVPLFRSNERK
jgi:hypothetical protein